MDTIIAPLIRDLSKPVAFSARRFSPEGDRPIVHETGYPDPPDSGFPAPVFCRILSELRDEFAAIFAASPELH
jgi:hypothetical protein